MNAEEFALSVVNDLHVNQGMNRMSALDPAITMIIVEIMRNLVERCNVFQNVKDGVEVSRNPGLLQRIALRLLINNVLDSKEARKQYSKQIHSAFLSQGGTMTEEKLKAIVEDLQYGS